MKETILEPMLADERVIAQFTGNVIVDKGLIVNIPNGYQAIVLIDEKAAFRIPSCMGKKIADYDKHYIGKPCKIAFVRTKPLAPMMFGFGNIPIRNEKRGESYRIGANGTYTIEIADMSKLINFFETENVITVDQVREHTISAIKNVGVSVFGDLFEKAEASAFEASARINEVRDALTHALDHEPVFAEMGVHLKALSVNGIHVNEEDLEAIREKMQSENKGE